VTLWESYALLSKLTGNRQKIGEMKLKKMIKSIQKKMKTEKTIPENSGKTLGKNVEIPYNIKRDNETQHLTNS
jgi:hypothetical protein